MDDYNVVEMYQCPFCKIIYETKEEAIKCASQKVSCGVWVDGDMRYTIFGDFWKIEVSFIGKGDTYDTRHKHQTYAILSNLLYYSGHSADWYLEFLPWEHRTDFYNDFTSGAYDKIIDGPFKYDEIKDELTDEEKQFFKNKVPEIEENIRRFDKEAIKWKGYIHEKDVPEKRIYGFVRFNETVKH